MIANFFGHDISLGALRRLMPLSSRGATIADMMRLARHLGLDARAVRASADRLLRMREPCIAHWHLDHFVVVEPTRRGTISIVDPAVGQRLIDNDEWRRNFTGVALLLQPGSRFEPAKIRPSLRLRHLLQGVRGVTSVLLQILALSLAMQVLVLLMPFYSQVVLDEVVVGGDVGLLHAVFAVAVLLTLFQVVLMIFRRWAVLHFGMRLRLVWNAQLFSHLLRLPLSFFNARHTGDLQSRFRSLHALQELVSGNVVEAVLDGVMAMTTCVALYLYAPGLATLVLLTVLAYLLMRCALLPMRDRLLREAIVATARKDTVFLETLRAVMPLKNFSAEQWRENQYAKVTTASVNRDTRVAALSIVESGIRQLLLGLQFVCVVWLAAKLILASEMTAGMMVAFLAFSAQFSNRSATFVDRCMDLRLLRVHLERLSDIAESDPEPLSTPAVTRNRWLCLDARDLGYRYGATEPWIFRGVDFSIRRGEHVVITGPSGCGKTTLLKVLAGLLQPEEGELHVNAMPVLRFGLVNFREQLGVVMQHDVLLSGSLLENIAFFAVDISMTRVTRCAILAGIHHEIVAMPMQYNTRVGDMGHALSGGQLQRVLLARALYRNPQLLFLDEASSHLDKTAEQGIIANLRRVRVSVISIAHRAESIRCADRVFELPAEA